MSDQWSLVTRIMVLCILLILGVVGLYVLRPLIPPLIVAGILAYILNPLTLRLQNRFKWRHQTATAVVYFLFLLLLVAMPSTLIPLLANELRTIANELVHVQAQIEAYVANPVIILGRIIFLDQIWRFILEFISHSLTPATADAAHLLETTSASVTNIILVLVTAYYFLLDWHGLEQWLLSLFPEVERDDIQRLIDKTDEVWWAYVRGTFYLMLIMGVVFALVGLVIGLPGAVALGILTGLLSMIPEIGPIIAGLVATLIALVEGSYFLPLPNALFALLVAGIYFVLMQVKSFWLRPLVMGRFMHMNTGLVFVAIIGAIILQGILGALIILPILATAGIVGRYVWRRLLNLPPWE